MLFAAASSSRELAHHYSVLSCLVALRFQQGMAKSSAVLHTWKYFADQLMLTNLTSLLELLNLSVANQERNVDCAVSNVPVERYPRQPSHLQGVSPFYIVLGVVHVLLPVLLQL